MAGRCKYCGARTRGRYRICPYCRGTKRRSRGGDLTIPLIFLALVIYMILPEMKTSTWVIIGSLMFCLVALYGYYKTKKYQEKKYTCDNCGYDWKSKKTFGTPAICPKCNSKNIIPYLKTPKGKKKKRNLKVIWIIYAILFIFFLAYPLGILTFKENSTEEIPNQIQTTNNISKEESLTSEEELIEFCISQFLNAGFFDLEKTEYFSDFSSASDWIRNNYESPILTQEQKEININYIIKNKPPKEDYPIVITYRNKNEGQMVSKGFSYCNKNGVI